MDGTRPAKCVEIDTFAATTESGQDFYSDPTLFLTNLLSLYKFDFAQFVSLDRSQVVHHFQDHTLPFAWRKEGRRIIAALVARSFVVFELCHSARFELLSQAQVLCFLQEHLKRKTM